MNLHVYHLGLLNNDRDYLFTLTEHKLHIIMNTFTGIPHAVYYDKNIFSYVNTNLYVRK
jgi:hypothetical protein